MTNKNKDAKDQEGKTGKTFSFARVVTGGLVVALGISMALVATRFEPPRDSGAQMPFLSINDELEKIGARDAILPLTMNDGEIDLLYTGAPGCSHCQAFMGEGFAKMLSLARDNDLDFAYMPAAMSGYDIALAAVEACAAPSATVPGETILRETYRTVAPLAKAVDQAREAIEAGTQPESDAMTPVWGVLGELHARMGSTSPMDRDCYEAKVEEISAQMTAFSESFDLRATPSFYIRSGQNVVRVIGEPDPDMLADMIAR